MLAPLPFSSRMSRPHQAERSASSGNRERPSGLRRAVAPVGVDDRRHHVDVRDGPAVAPVARDARSAHDERDAHGLLVEQDLLGLGAMLAVHEAVVGGEHDQRVGELAGTREGVHDVGHRLVDGLEALELLAPVLRDRGLGLGVEARAVGDDLRLVADAGLVEIRGAREGHAVELVAVARLGRGGADGGRVVRVARRAAVGSDEPELEVERPVAGRGLLDQLAGTAAEEVGLVLARVGRVGVGDERAVLVDAPARVVEGVRVGRAVPVAPAGRDAVRVLVAVEVAADVHGPVAGGLEPDGQRVGVVEAREAAERPGVVEDLVVVGVLAGEVRGARGAAEREAGHRVLEQRALARQQPVDVGHVAQRGGGLVVGHEDDDVGLGEGGRGGGQGGQHEKRRGEAPGSVQSSARPSPR